MAELVYTLEKEQVLRRLLFSPGPHVYTLDGMRIGSVTQVLDTYTGYGFIPKEVREAALLRGTLVHALTERLDREEMDSEDWHLAEEADLVGYIRAYEKFKRDFPITVIAVEGKVYHTRYRYSGTFDRIYEATEDIIENGKLVVPAGFPILGELKTGSMSPYYALQTAAYVAAIADGGIDIGHRWCICLKPNGTYERVKHEAKDDLPAFLGALKMQEWKQRYDR